MNDYGYRMVENSVYYREFTLKQLVSELEAILPGKSPHIRKCRINIKRTAAGNEQVFVSYVTVPDTATPKGK